MARLPAARSTVTALPFPSSRSRGNWNVNIDPKTPAPVTLNVFYDGSHHLAFGYNALMLVSFVDGVYVFSGFGDAATATLDTSVTPATFSWHVELGGGCPPEHPYNSLTYFGRGRSRPSVGESALEQIFYCHALQTFGKE